MNNLEAMANMIEEEGKHGEKPGEKLGGEGGAPEALTEERAAEMIETAVKKATGEAAQAIAGFSETLKAMQTQLETIKPKEEGENNA